jgi:hypothetical protein
MFGVANDGPCGTKYERTIRIDYEKEFSTEMDAFVEAAEELIPELDYDIDE